MAPLFWSLILLLGFSIGQANQSSDVPDVFTPAEKVDLAKSAKIDGRIKVYQAASQRFRSSLEAEMAKHEYSPVPETLQSWAQVLKISLKDIDQSITNRKKKSGALKNYEIRLRKSITDVQAYKTAVPVDMIDEFDNWLKQAEDVHQKLVDILFPK
jgi:hypothetical protein